MVREADAVRGQIGIGPGTAGAVYLLQANVAGDDGAAETFYWAEGYVTFTPEQFRMALQWTTLPGPGGWHTCEYDFTFEHGRVRTVAVQRDIDGDGAKDVYFRVCMSYRSHGSTTWMVDCTGRY